MPKVLVAPGSGDIHWVMLKMESIIQQHFNGETPEIWVWSESRRTERSEGYIKRIPFVKWGGYYHASPMDVKVGQNVFVHGKPWISTPWRSFDMFVAFNAPLGWGEQLENMMPNCEINWDYELKLTFADLEYGRSFSNPHDPYVVVSFFGHSFYGEWLKHFTVADIRGLLAEVSRTHRVVLTGCEWDEKFMAKLWSPGFFDVTGKTSMGQLLGLMKYAKAFVGFAAGNGMLAQHLRCPTFMLWKPDQWSPKFATNWVDPKRIEDGTYHPMAITAPCIDYIVEKINEPSVHRDGSGVQRQSVDGGAASVGGVLGAGERQATDDGGSP